MTLPIVNPKYASLELQHRALNEEIQFYKPGSLQYEQTLIQLNYIKQQMLLTKPLK